jgi:hypothetical protein
MERCLTEEDVTLSIKQWLELNRWDIVCFDFPQSGTGVSLHPNEKIRESKNKGDIIPDIVAIKNGTVVFFENKDRFVLNDFIKVDLLRQSDDYSESIKELLKKYIYTSIYYGVGLPFSTTIRGNLMRNIHKIDFAVFVSSDRSISFLQSTKEIFP